MEDTSNLVVSSEPDHPKTPRVVAAAVSSVLPGIGQVLLGKTRPGIIVKFDQHASQTSTIKPRATGLKQLDLGIDDVSYPVSDTPL
jgi:hypothetical protein